MRVNAVAVEVGRGGVSFQGDRTLLYQVKPGSRTAIRVLWPILQVQVTTPEELYEAGAHHRLVAVSDAGPARWRSIATLRDSHLTHSKYAALKTKDAICDQFIDKCGRRPSVDVETPMVGLNLHIYRDEAILSLDSSGESLHKRGYRPALTKPLLQRGAGGGPGAVDRLRGAQHAVSRSVVRFGHAANRSGVAGAAAAARIDTQAVRLSELDGFRHRVMGGDLDEARQQMLKTLPVPVIGSDLRCDVVNFAEGNARAAGVFNLIQFETKSILQLCRPAWAAGDAAVTIPQRRAVGR